MLRRLPFTDKLRLLYTWELWARPDQIDPMGPEDHLWLLEGGRGCGKTRAAAEWIIARARSGEGRRIALLGRTPADVRDVMIEGESGILACSPPAAKPKYEPTKRRLTWPRPPSSRYRGQRVAVGTNPPVATAYSAKNPDELRGPQHDTAWLDEIATYPDSKSVDNLLMGLRIGRDPKAMATTTPRTLKWLKRLKSEKGVVVSKATTYDNLHNLGPGYEQIIARYKGTRLERQELHGIMLDDIEGAILSYEDIAKNQRERSEVPKLQRVGIGVDPAASAKEDSDETGIVVGGLGYDGHAYLLADLSGRMKPAEWAAVVGNAFAEYEADRIIAEKNNGGDMVSHTIHTANPNLPVRSVHASRGKAARAEPYCALYEQGRIHHVGDFVEIEDQLLGFTPQGWNGDGSPDRAEAWIWLLHELMPNRGGMLRRLVF